MNRMIALVLSAAVGASGCGAARAQTRVAPPPPLESTQDFSVMASYIRQIPVGSRVRVSLADGSVVKGTLMKADADPIVIQKRTRIPVAPLAIAIKDVQAMELEGKNGGPAKAIAVGAAAGAGAAVGMLLILAAIFAGD
jgi:hypothetical protein